MMELKIPDGETLAFLLNSCGRLLLLFVLVVLVRIRECQQPAPGRGERNWMKAAPAVLFGVITLLTVAYWLR